jgi:hypothetical protein
MKNMTIMEHEKRSFQKNDPTDARTGITDGRLEEWKNGRVEGWKDGRMSQRPSAVILGGISMNGIRRRHLLGSDSLQNQR